MWRLHRLPSVMNVVTNWSSDAPDEPLVQARGLTKSYSNGSGEIEVLHGVSLELRSERMYAVMGPSGSGKSTLMHLLAGLEQPSTGEVRLLGRPLGSISRAAAARMRRQEIGFVFQALNLMPSLSAFENIALPIRLRGQRVDPGWIEEALERVGLGTRGGDRPSVMSGGEQQRVAIARALAQEPRVVFADEPTGALDSVSGARVLEELHRLAQQPGKCVLTVTHDPQVAASCDHVLFLRDGYLLRELASPNLEKITEVLAEIAVEAVSA